MTNKTLLTAAILMALAGSGAAYGQGLLDQQLGPAAPAAPTAAPKKDAAPADKAPDKTVDKLPTAPDTAKADAAKNPPASAAPGGDIISTDAAKKVDDDELRNQLLKPGAKPDPNEVSKRLHAMVDRMQQTATLLTNKDPGEVTQETQRRIVSDLDVMIELARQQQQQGSSSSSGPPQPGQARQPGQPGPKGEGGSTAATHDPLPRGGYSDPAVGDMHSRDPANWGGLPPRDRDQVSHGANEEYLTAYKDLIDRYYQALAEMGKSRGR